MTEQTADYRGLRGIRYKANGSSTGSLEHSTAEQNRASFALRCAVSQPVSLK